MFKLGSTMSIGTWLMTMFILVSLAYLAASLLTVPFRWGAKVRRVVGILGLPLALLVTIYTGVLLSASPKSPWNTPMLPVVFVASALATGIAAVVFILAAIQIVRKGALADSPVPKLEKLYGPVIAFQLVMVILFVLVQIGSPQMRSMIGSGYGLLWWVGIVGLGLILPIVVGFKGGTKRPQTSLVVSALVLLGGFFLRYVILMAGQVTA